MLCSSMGSAMRFRVMQGKLNRTKELASAATLSFEIGMHAY